MVETKGIKRFTAHFITYEAAMWIVHVVLVTLACADRFTWNIWPRQNTFNIGGKPAGWDKVDGLLDGPWSVKLYDIIVRFSGRFMILALNLMLFVRLRTVETRLASSWLSRNIIDCSNIVKANIRLHIWNGFAVVIFVLMHVWSIFLPCLIHGYTAQLKSGPFEWPISERRESDFKDVDAAAEMVNLQIDDIYRMISTTAFVGILAHLSFYLWARYRAIAIHLHRFMAAVFCIEIVRRYAHPHAMILNTPVIFLWVVDRIIFQLRNHSSLDQYQKIMLGEDYMVLLWKAGRTTETLAPNFYLKLKDNSMMEDGHPFTAFQNRRGIQVSSVPEEWTTGMVIRVYRNKRKFPLASKKNQSHTGRMAYEDSAVIEARGPYSGEMSELIVQNQNGVPSKCSCSVFKNFCWCLNSISRTTQEYSPVVLVGTGSGVNYLLDAMQYPFKGGNQLIIIWCTGDNLLFNWVREFVDEILAPEDTHLKITLVNTRRRIEGENSDEFHNSHPRVVKYKTGRISFEKEVPDNSQIFFQGSESVRKALYKACRKKKCSLARWGFPDFFNKKSLDQITERSLVYVNQGITTPFERQDEVPQTSETFESV